jgi:hypothetical protein
MGSEMIYARAFEQLVKQSGVDHTAVSRLPDLFQDFRYPPASFEIVLLHNSINHLDEPACIRLPHDLASRSAYQGIFRKLGELAADGALLVICDASRYNFWNHMGLASPFSPSIEWHKHQPPELWAQMSRRVGFELRDLRWSTPNAWGSLGQKFLGRRTTAYFLHSHFCLTMYKPRMENAGNRQAA